MSASRHMRSLAAVALCAVVASPKVDAQNAASTNLGCIITQGQATCNWVALRAALAAANTVALEYGTMDQPTGTQLKDLAKKLGKQIATIDTPAALTFAIVAADNSGITLGPADQELVEFRIYAGPSSRGRLLWVESFRGQPDRPWTMSVRAVIQQFEERLAHAPRR